MDTGITGAVDDERPSWASLTVTITAKSAVFDVNPIALIGDPSIVDADDANSAVPCPAYTPVDLPLLTAPAPGAPWKIEGTYCKITDMPTPSGQTTLGFVEPTSRTADFPAARGCDTFSAVNAYYHITENQLYIQSLGYTGLIGINERQISVDHMGFTDDNSFYVSSPSGEGYLSFGEGGVDDAEDPEVVVHEYGHAIQDNQSPGTWFGDGHHVDAFGESFGDETGAMGEGFGDFWACTTNATLDPFFAEWDGPHDDPPAGFPDEDQDFGLRQLANHKEFPKDMEDQVHEDGEIWSGALYDLFMTHHAAGDGSIVHKVVLDSHFFTPEDPTFVDAAEALATVDAMFYGSALEEDLKAIFVDRGIFHRILLDSFAAADTPDVFGDTTGSELIYGWGEFVTLVAPEADEDGVPFSRWVLDDVLQPVGDLTLTVNMKQTHVVHVLYGDPDLGTTELTQSVSLDIDSGSSPACAFGGISLDNAFARSYDLSAMPATVGRAVTIMSIDVGVGGNTGSEWIGQVKVYLDTDGEAPVSPEVDLEEIGASLLHLGEGVGPHVATVYLEEPIVVPADSIIVVEMSYPPHCDGIVFSGANSEGETGPTYIRAAGCGVPTYATAEDLDLEGVHLVQVVRGDVEVTADIDGDGVVGVTDLVALVLAWGDCPDLPEPCSADLNGDGSVDVSDLVELLLAWS
jgi:hypothetical protein